jgi:hypothetical protein
VSPLDVSLVVPKEIAAALRAGTLERVGGVVRQVAGKKEVVAWLRDAAPAIRPSEPAKLLQGAAQAGKAVQGVARALQGVSAITSVLNLGATLGLGIANYRVTQQVQKQLGLNQAATQASIGQLRQEAACNQSDIQASIGHLRSGLLAVLDRVVTDQGAILVKLDADRRRDAVELLRSVDRQLRTLRGPAQDEYGRIDDKICGAAERFRSFAIASISAAVRTLEARKERSRVAVQPDEVSALTDLREVLIVADMRAGVLAVRGMFNEAAQDAEHEAGSARDLLMTIAAAFFGDGVVWGQLLDHRSEDAASFDRVGRLVQAFEQQTGGLQGVIRRLFRHVVPATGIADVDQRARETGSRSLLRAYEVAKQLNLDPKDMMGLFHDVGVNDVRNHMSLVDAEALARVQAVVHATRLWDAYAKLKVEAETFAQNGDQLKSETSERWANSAAARLGEELARSARLRRVTNDSMSAAAEFEHLVPFLDLLEGVADDIERLRGRAAEYQSMAAADTDLQTHAERFVRVEVTPELRQRFEQSDGPEQLYYTDPEAVERVLRALR